MADPASSELYVGYLPTPRPYARFLRLVAPALVGALAAGAVLLARSQHSAGPGVWDDSAPKEFRGVVVGGPYPVLFAPDRGDGRPGPMLIVASGKHGASDRLAKLDGRGAVLKGTLLHRGEGRMIELDDAEDAAAESPSAAAAPPTIALGRVTLRGEIVDSKCFLGAMKPGHGRPHKECATLCISGGIPPSLIYRAPDGTTGSCLLLDASGGPLGEAAYPFIADPVEVTGELEEQGGIQRLKVRTDDIVRL